jgi:hypothetical protein
MGGSDMSMIGIISSSKGSYKELDTDASAFISAAGLSTNQHKAAINNLVKQFKYYGLWTKCTAIYPFIGGTAAAHKFNLKDPRDLDAAFRLVFTGTITHSAAGFIPAINSGYAETFINASTQLTLNNAHLSLWGHNNGSLGSAGNYDMGAQVGAVNTARIIFGLRGSNASTWDTYNSTVGQGRASVANNSTAGFYGIGTRTAADSSVYYSGTASVFAGAIVSIATTGGSPPNANIFINGLNSTNIQNIARTYIFASVGTGLSATDALNMWRAVTAYNLALRRTAS